MNTCRVLPLFSSQQQQHMLAVTAIYVGIYLYAILIYAVWNKHHHTPKQTNNKNEKTEIIR